MTAHSLLVIELAVATAAGTFAGAKGTWQLIRMRRSQLEDGAGLQQLNAYRGIWIGIWMLVAFVPYLLGLGPGAVLIFAIASIVPLAVFLVLNRMYLEASRRH